MPNFGIEAAKANMAKQFSAGQERRARWGEQGPPHDAILAKMRMVAAYNDLPVLKVRSCDVWLRPTPPEPCKASHQIVSYYQEAIAASERHQAQPAFSST